MIKFLYWIDDFDGCPDCGFWQCNGDCEKTEPPFEPEVNNEK